MSESNPCLVALSQEYYFTYYWNITETVSPFAHLPCGSPFKLLFPITSAVPFVGETFFNYDIPPRGALHSFQGSTPNRTQAVLNFNGPIYCQSATALGSENHLAQGCLPFLHHHASLISWYRWRFPCGANLPAP